MKKSNISVNILEPIYAGGVISGTSAAGNLPEVFSIDLDITGSPAGLVVGTNYQITDSNGGQVLMAVTYVGKDRSTGQAIFRIVSVDASQSANKLETIFATATAGIYTDATNFIGFIPSSVDYTESNTNHVQGFAAAGLDDTDAWTANGHDGTKLLGGNSREVGEKRNFRTLGFRKWNHNFSARTHKVKIAWTREMYQDMMMEEDVDLRSMGDVIGTQELSQSINQEVLSYVFAHGWSSHIQLNTINGFDANLHLATTATTAPFQHVGRDNVMLAMAGNTPAGLSSSLTHTLGSAQRLLVSRIGYAGGVIGNRTRSGKGNVVVTGTSLASPICDIRGFREVPFDNTLVDGAEDTVLKGTFKGMSLYEDSTMAIGDRRVSVSRKGDDKSSGLALCNYILAEKTGTVAEETGEDVSFLYSRMVVAEKGTNPSINYLTFIVDGLEII